MRDPYTVLGVSKGATEADIKKAYRTLAKKHHPDHNQNDPKAVDRLAEVNQAYEILGEADKRARFDRGEIGADGKPRGFEGFGGGPGGRSGGGFGGNPFGFDFSSGARGPGGFGAGGAGMEDLIQEMMRAASTRSGAGRQQSGPGGAGFGGGPGAGPGASQSRARDFEITVRIPAEMFVAGGKARVDLPSGKTVDVSVAALSKPGDKVRLRGQGREGPMGMDAGDALITLEPQANGRFRPDGADLYADVAVSLEDVVLGSKVKADLPEGTSAAFTLQPGTSANKPIRLKGKGLPKADGTRGDLYLTPRITLPEAGDPELEALLRRRRRP
jgi:DnaJ-class molecular chaperone